MLNPRTQTVVLWSLGRGTGAGWRGSVGGGGENHSCWWVAQVRDNPQVLPVWYEVPGSASSRRQVGSPVNKGNCSFNKKRVSSGQTHSKVDFIQFYPRTRQAFPFYIHLKNNFYVVLIIYSREKVSGRVKFLKQFNEWYLKLEHPHFIKIKTG